MIPSTIFQTNRLTVRPLTMADLPTFHEMQGNPKVMRYTTGRPNTLEKDRIELAEVIAHYASPQHTFRIWAIVSTETLAFIGTVALIQNEAGENEIGYRLLERFWGKGYGKEIVSGIIHYATITLKLPSLVAYVAPDNIPSVKILDRSPLRAVAEYFSETYNEMERKYVWP